MRRLALLVALAACGDNDRTQTLYVSPAGDDAATGAAEAPLRSLAGARDAVRRMRGEGRIYGPIDVVFAPGVYEMTAPVVFTPEDSGTAELPVRFVGAGATLSGGTRLSGFTVDGDVWRLETAHAFSQLWVGDVRATRAREPDGYGDVIAASEAPLGPLDDSGRYTLARQTIELDPALLASIDGPDPIFQAVHRWDTTKRPIETILPDAITTVGRGMKPWNPIDAQSRYFIENFPAALDEPGEFFLSRAGELRYRPRPGEDPATTEVHVPIAEQLVIIRGEAGAPVTDLAFDGFTFAYAEWVMPTVGLDPMQTAWWIGGTIEVDHAQRIAFENCEVAHVGRYGIWLRDGVRDAAVRHCELHDLGAGGIRIGDRALPTDETRTERITVDNNLIHGGGQLGPSAVGIFVAQSPRNTITHNTIADFYYSGISLGWTWGDGPTDTDDNVVAFNHIAHLGKGLMSDLGGIYTLGTSNGTVLDGNVIHDITARAYGGWGLYNDEGSSGFTLTNNLVYRTSGGPYHLQYGRGNTLANNILAFGGEHQLRVSVVDKAHALDASRNIVVWDAGILLFGPILDAGVALERNLYWNANGVDFLGLSLAEWQALGQDAGSIVGDPQLSADFRTLGPLVDKIGFERFDPAKAGLYGDAAWRARADAVLRNAR